MALTCGLMASMRCRNAATTSRAEPSLAQLASELSGGQLPDTQVLP